MQAVTDIFSTKILFVLLSISIAVNAFLLYRLFNTALSLDYSRSENRLLKERSLEALEIIKHLTPKLSEKQLKTIGSVLSKKDIVVKISSKEVQIGNILFTVDGEKIIYAEYLE